MFHGAVFCPLHPSPADNQEGLHVHPHRIYPEVPGFSHGSFFVFSESLPLLTLSFLLFVGRSFRSSFFEPSKQYSSSAIFHAPLLNTHCSFKNAAFFTFCTAGRFQSRSEFSFSSKFRSDSNSTPAQIQILIRIPTPAQIQIQVRIQILRRIPVPVIHPPVKLS